MYRARAPTRPLSVLIVDDYPDSAICMVYLLALEGFTARAALSGGEALAAAEADPPDVVVLEPRTPGGGWALAHRLGEKVAGRRPLLVALTTDTTAAARRAADEAGIDLYLVKPADPAALVGVLRRYERATAEVDPAGGGAAHPLRRRAGILRLPRINPAGRIPAAV